VAVRTWSVPGAAGYPIVLDVEESEAMTADARRAIRGAVAGVPGAEDVAVQAVALEGSAARTLLCYASRADQLFVGSRGHGAIAGFVIGSVSQQCAQHSRCPVTIVRPE
jgi:nucleotide-binding universal stress UspA family protein